jgi:hypothetical protein
MKISESKWKSNLEGITGILFHTYVDRQFSFFTRYDLPPHTKKVLEP